MTDKFNETVNDLFWNLKSYTFIVADTIDRQADVLANRIRDSLASAEWLPEAARPAPRPVPIPQRVIDAVSRKNSWWRDNRWFIVSLAVVGSVVGMGGYGYLTRKKGMKKRRAKRAGNGGRKEVVVIAGGSPHDPIVRSLSLDLERRGFVVFVVVNSIEDEQVVVNEGRADIKALNVDILDVCSFLQVAAIGANHVDAGRKLPNSDREIHHLHIHSSTSLSGRTSA